MTKTLEELQFINSFAKLPDVFYVKLPPTALNNNRLSNLNAKAAALIDLSCDQLQREEFLTGFTSESFLANMEPLASCYAGHQFGQLVPRLGDGRALLLGEIRNQKGERWELQLKGSGLTPYSRQGDGRAVLRSTIREYLGSEAMAGLGIPTTRALCIFSSEEEVYRESIETGAMLIRMAPSHVRFGHFEYYFYQKDYHHLRLLADYSISHDYPWLVDATEPYLAWFEEITGRTATLIAQWQAAGFAHGVMNTDNMSVLGLTIDYGPYGFLDQYEPGFICNHSDHSGRYAFDQQPQVGLFNLTCFAQAILPLLSSEPETAILKAQGVLQTYQVQYEQAFQKRMRAKLGFRAQHHEDETLLYKLLQLLAENRVDYSIFFRSLSQFKQAEDVSVQTIRDQFLDREAFDVWAREYQQRLALEATSDAARATRMNQLNPKFILRNYLAENAIRKACDDKDYSEIDTLLHLLQQPFDEHPEHAHYADLPPDWAQKISVSCSS